MRTTNNMILFWGGILSNWAPTPYTHNGKRYCCSEQQFMESKAMYFGDHRAADLIMRSTDPKRIKDLGRKVRGYNDDAWSKVREMYMRECVKAKFFGNEKAKAFLMKQPETHIFVEASPYDKIWGIGLSEDDPRAWDQATWRGQNLLGKIITMVYKELKNNGNLFQDGINT